MRFLPDPALYEQTDVCLRFLQGLGDDRAGPTGRRYHLYWEGPFGRKQAFAVKSLLATQDLDGGEVWLWLGAWSALEASRHLRPLLPFARFTEFFAPMEFLPERPLTASSYRDFFRGAFAYHWHNCWDAPEPESSYFSRFDREFDEVLRGRRALEPPARNVTSFPRG